MTISGFGSDRDVTIRVGGPANMPFLVTFFVLSLEGHRLNCVIRGVVPIDGIFIHQQNIPFRALDIGFSNIISEYDCQPSDSKGEQPVATAAFDMDGPVAERRVPRGPISFGGI